MKKRKFLWLMLSTAVIIATITVAAAVMMLPAGAESATVYSGTCGENLAWSLDIETGVLNITGTGEMTNFRLAAPTATTLISDAPWYSYRSDIKSVNIAEGVTSIGSYAFYDCTGIESIDIPASVTKVEKIAISSAASLTVNENNTAFHSEDNCIIDTENKKLVAGCAASIIPADGSVTIIGQSAFHHCSAMTSVEIPETITKIDDYAFEGCSSLKSIHIPSSVAELGRGVFVSCTSLETVTFGKDIKIKDLNSTFFLCGSLKNIEIPQSITTIGADAFSGCWRLENITIPQFVTKIYQYAFMNCSSLEAISIPEGVTDIHLYTFKGCSSLESVDFPIGINTIGEQAFEGCTALKEIAFKDNSALEIIGNSAFRGCSNLTSVYFGANIDLERIAQSAFSDCNSELVIKCHEKSTPHSYAKSNSLGFELIHYTLTDIKSNGDGTHSGVCTCGETATVACSGGDATCTDKAICTICLAAYGEINAENHAFSDTLTQGETSHYYVCTRCDAKNGEDDHEYMEYTSNGDNTHSSTCVCGSVDTKVCSGGDATCTEKAVCHVCNTAYGETAVHQYYSYTSNEDNTHSAKCSSCESIDTQPCYGGSANCVEKAICEICNTAYGELSEEHDYSDKLSSGEEFHYYECKLCQAHKDEAAHEFKNYKSKGNDTHSGACVCGKTDTQSCSGGTATCENEAVCEVCNTSYGEREDHETVIKNDENLHWDECSKCGSIYNSKPHTVGEDNLCTVCGYGKKRDEDTSVPDKPAESSSCLSSVSGTVISLASMISVAALAVFRKKDD